MSDYQSKFTGEEIDSILEDAKNKPFGDNLPVTEYFSQAETPNPVSFESAELGMTAYKVFDFILTTEQIMQGVTVKTNGVEENPLNGTMQSLGNVAVMFTMPSGYMYAGFAQSGELVIDPTYGITVNVPEVGIYFLLPYGTPLLEGLNIEVNYIGTKKIDPKYLPLNSTGIPTVTISERTIEGDYIYLTDEEANMVYKISKTNLPAYVIWSADGTAFIFNHIGSGNFSLVTTTTLINGSGGTTTQLLTITLSYNHNNKAFEVSMYFSQSSSSTTTTYSLRGNTEQPTIAEVIEMLRESARERGLL